MLDLCKCASVNKRFCEQWVMQETQGNPSKILKIWEEFYLWVDHGKSLRGRVHITQVSASYNYPCMYPSINTGQKIPWRNNQPSDCANSPSEL